MPSQQKLESVEDRKHALEHACKANARTVLKEKRATTLTQFLIARLIIQCGEEADRTPVSQDVKETHKFAVETAKMSTSIR